MEVIGVGLGRTGTASLKAALERLGLGPCDHMFEVMEKPDRVRLWHRIGGGERPDWAEVFAGYHATVDWPGAAYWRELADAFPQAKLILTIRDPHRWYDSAFKTIFGFPMRRHGWLEHQAFTMVRKLNPSAAEVPMMLDRVIWDRVFDGRMFDGSDADRAYAIERFHRHTEEVKAYVPQDRLLIFDVAEGWEPLCAFLGLPVPDEPFPRINDAAAFNQAIAARSRAAIVPIAGSFAGIAAVIAGVAVGAAIGSIVPALIAAAAGAVSTVGVFGVVYALMNHTERRRERRGLQTAASGPGGTTDQQPNRSLALHE